MGYTDEEFLATKDYFLAILEAALKIRETYEDDTSGGDVFFDAIDDMLDILDEGEAR